MRGSSRAGHRNLDPRTRRLHRRHQSLCHSGRPSDTARVAEYEAGPYAGFGDEIMQAFSAIVPGDADASLVADAIVNVVDTPFFAVSDGDGHFEIKGLPAGTYTLAAVHEKLGEQTMTVTVAPQTTGKADFGYAMK